MSKRIWSIARPVLHHRQHLPCDLLCTLQIMGKIIAALPPLSAGNLSGEADDELQRFLYQTNGICTGQGIPCQKIKAGAASHGANVDDLIRSGGTIVYLNSESSLSYPSRFNGDFRKVTLSGEAYFEVAKDPEKKFILSTTHQSQIEVLGTCFNVEAYEQNTEVITTLIEGKVDFMFEKDAGVKHVFLSPREKLVYDSETDKVHLYKTSGKSELAWKDGEVVLDNTPLEEALWMLEKRYSVKFVIKNEKLKNSSFTGTFTNQRLEKILEYFKVSSKIRWQHINDDKDGSDRKKEIIEIY